MKQKIENSFWWIFQTIGLSVLVGLIPGILGLTGEIINGINKYVDIFFDLSWGIKIPVYLFLGLCLKFWLANKYPQQWNQKKWN
ncbi:hypothetical protein KAJ89_00325 [Candidatus Parcubacteria bacterium]|nr:hypothetical protein [Candidatus Parcubacteria bacterium]